MNKLRTASAVVGAVAAVAIGGAAFAAGGDDPSPSPSATDDRGGSVEMLPDGTVVDDNPSPSDSASPSVSPSVPATSALSISIDRAKAIALRVAGGGYVESVEGETEHGRAVWDVDVIRNGVEHDIDVDRATGAVTRHRVKSTSAGSKPKVAATHDAGDDHGSGGNGADDPAGDDRGGHGTDDKPGNDKAGHGTDDKSGHGADDKGGHGADDKGGQGGEDKGGDDHGSGGHGSDD